jgi:hypothetical protein
MVIDVTEEWRKTKGLQLTQLVEADITNRRGWDASRSAARYMYYGNTTRPDIHFEDATDIHLGLVYENIERLVPRMNNAFWNVDPHVIVDRTPQDYDPRETRTQEKFINWAIDYDIPDLYSTTHAWFRNMLIDGNSSLKTRHLTEWRRTAELHRLKIDWVRGEMTSTGLQVNEERRAKQPEDLLDELFGPENWQVHQAVGSDTLLMTIVEDRRERKDGLP